MLELGRVSACLGLTHGRLELDQKEELEEPQLQPSGAQNGLTIDRSHHFPPGSLRSVPGVIRPSPVPTSVCAKALSFPGGEECQVGGRQIVLADCPLYHWEQLP